MVLEANFVELQIFLSLMKDTLVFSFCCVYRLSIRMLAYVGVYIGELINFISLVNIYDQRRSQD